MATLEQRRRPLRNIKPPRWMRRRRPPRAKVKFKWAPLDKTEAETDRRYEYDQRKHRLFSHAATVFELQFGLSLDHFVTSVDPLRQWRMLRQAADPLALAPTQRVEAWTRAADEAMAIAADIRRAIPNTSRIWTPSWNVTADFFPATKNRYCTERDLPVLPGRQLLNVRQQQCDHDQIDVPIVIDSGASLSLTPFKNDFISPPEKSALKELNNVSSTSKVEGEGTVAWKIIDFYGVVHTIRTRAYYVPSASIRLYSPQRHFQQQLEGVLTLTHDQVILRPSRSVSLRFPFHPMNGLPLMFLDDERRGHIAGMMAADSAMFNDVKSILTNVADETNQNLSGPQRELLLWHHKLGHINFDWLQTLARQGRNSNQRRVFESKFASIANCRAPLCAACQMGKGKRRPTGAKQAFDVNEMKLKEETLHPGDRLHIDQYKSTTTGRLPHTKGHEKSSFQYNGGLIAVDGASGKVFVRHQVSLAAGETIQAMRAIAQDARDHGVCFKTIHTDNAPFNSIEFRD